MSNPNYTHIVMLVDASGSMKETKDATIAGINNFMTSQKKITEGTERNLSFDEDMGDSVQALKCTGTLVFFSSKDPYSFQVNSYGNAFTNNGEPTETYSYIELYKNADILTAPEVTADNYNPYGGTPLIDAFCKAIMDCSAYVAMLPEDEKPGRVIFVSITDGAENSSTKFKRADLNEKISDMQKLNWQFIYLGANQDAIQESSKYGVAQGQSLTYEADEDGIIGSFDMLAANVSSKRFCTPDKMFEHKISDEARHSIEPSYIAQVTNTTFPGRMMGIRTNELHGQFTYPAGRTNSAAEIETRSREIAANQQVMMNENNVRIAAAMALEESLQSQLNAKHGSMGYNSKYDSNL